MRLHTLAIIFMLLSVFTARAHAAPDDDRLGRFLEQNGFITQLQATAQEGATQAMALVRNAMELLGVPYRYGGKSREKGLDCSGLVQAVYQESAGVELPRTSASQAAATEPIRKADLEPGDLVFFNTLRRAYSHVGIYIGEGRFIHAPRAGGRVRIESMDLSYWQKRFNGARRVALH